MSVLGFESMVGSIITKITGGVGDDEMTMRCIDGRVFVFLHYGDCCEYVRIEDVCGDLDDLIGSPLIVAEECTNMDDPVAESAACHESYTWTFYRFATAKGSVTVRWLGESNGYYSERVDFCLRVPKRFNGINVPNDCEDVI
jgi:hypothetical protein